MKGPLPHKPSSQRQAEERKQRLAKALRENLRKRKEQALSRKNEKEKTMTYHQILEGCYQYPDQEATINGLLESEVLKEFQASTIKGAYPPLCCVNYPEDIPLFQKEAERLAHFEDILIFGTGGSSLGGKTLYALSTQKKPHLHFIDNIDPHTFLNLLQKISIQKTGIFFISKSISTI